MEEINYNEFDKECVNLCKTLNEMDGLNTTESCCGHLKDLLAIITNYKLRGYESSSNE